jgi:hydrogenase-4 membrane subunit HyfE
MEIKRAVFIGTIIFIASLVINAFLARFFGIDLKSVLPKDIPEGMWLCGALFAILFSSWGAYVYFKSAATRANLKNGFLFGAIICVLSFLLDIIFLIFYKNGTAILLGYYSSFGYWLTFFLIICSSSMVGYLKGRKNQPSVE